MIFYINHRDEFGLNKSDYTVGLGLCNMYPSNLYKVRASALTKGKEIFINNLHVTSLGCNGTATDKNYYLGRKLDDITNGVRKHLRSNHYSGTVTFYVCVSEARARIFKAKGWAFKDYRSLPNDWAKHSTTYKIAYKSFAI